MATLGHPSTVAGLLADRAQQISGAEAVVSVDGAIRYTYGELSARVMELARGLSDLGIGPGDRVATMLETSCEYVEVWFALAWVGAIEVPVNTEHKGTFLARTLDNVNASAIVIDGRWVDRVFALEGPPLIHVVMVGGTSSVGVTSMVNRVPEVVDLEDLRVSGPAVAPAPREETDPVYVMHTSGTTGFPKGVVHTNESALHNAKPWVGMLKLQPNDVLYTSFPLFHTAARSAVVTAGMLVGARIVLRGRFSASAFWDDVRRWQATIFNYMGATVQMLCNRPDPVGVDPRTLRLGFGGAATTSLVEQFRRRFGVELIEVYGSTELGPVTARRPGDGLEGTTGRPVDGVDVAIWDNEGRALPADSVGEIVVRADTPGRFSPGYWGHGSLPLTRGWFRTGDAGSLTPAGALVFVDRINDVIRRRGENISSAEVEDAVCRHPLVVSCAAYAVPSELTEDEVMLAVVRHPDGNLDARTLFDFCNETMPRFAVPRYIRFVTELPVTASNKILKRELRDAGLTADTHDRQALGIEI
jgi:carnitine-CoA ligase